MIYAPRSARVRADSGKNQSKHTIMPIRAPACSKMRKPVSPG